MDSEELTASQVVTILRAESGEVSDELWHRVLARSRAGEAMWTVIAAGAMLPRMVTACARYARGPAQHIPDVESEVLTAVLEQVRALPAGTHDVAEHLWAAAANTASACGYLSNRDRRWLVPWKAGHDSAPEGRGPVTVLAEAVAAGAVTAPEAELIARTRLEGTSLGRAAEDLGIAYITARRWRRSAEEQVASSLVTDEFS